MAEGKQNALSITISTVDQATAGIRKINASIAAQLDKVRVPVRQLGASLGALATEAGLPKVAEGFAGVGRAAVGVLGTMAGIAVAVGLATHEIMGMVDHFAELNRSAKIIGVTVDSLAQLRFAAEQSGVSTEELDGALEKFNKQLGQLHTGGGQLAQFLQKVSPKLYEQVKAAKSNEEALGLMANAMQKITDPTKRALLATEAFGRGGQPLINMLSQGAAGVNKLKAEYAELAGPQAEAAATGSEIHHAMNRISAAMDGVKAAIVVGAAPALEMITGQVKDFLVSHRAEIAAFVKDFGEKLPGRISAVVDVFRGALTVVTPVWNALGGLRTAAITLAAVIGGKLVLSIVSLGVTLLTTPVGWIIAAVAAIGVAAYELIEHWDAVSGFFSDLWLGIKATFGGFFSWVWDAIKEYTPIGLITEHWEPIKGFFSSLWDGVTLVFKAAWETIKEIVDGIVWAVDKVTGAAKTVTDFLGITGGGAGENALGGLQPAFLSPELRRELGIERPPAAPGGPVERSETKVVVDFVNAPKGLRPAIAPGGTAAVDLNVGYQLGSLF